jgi:hypothetical protein
MTDLPALILPFLIPSSLIEPSASRSLKHEILLSTLKEDCGLFVASGQHPASTILSLSFPFFGSIFVGGSSCRVHRNFHSAAAYSPLLELVKNCASQYFARCVVVFATETRSGGSGDLDGAGKGSGMSISESCPQASWRDNCRCDCF